MVEAGFADDGGVGSALGQQGQIRRQGLQPTVGYRTRVNAEPRQNAAGEAAGQIEDGAHRAGVLGDGDDGGDTGSRRFVEGAGIQLLEVTVGVGKFDGH